MKEIQLTKGQVALVDDEDFEFFNQWKWQAHFNKNTNSFYAMRSFGVIKRHSKYMHRLIVNAPDNSPVDHVNHNTLDNQKENLRICTVSQNKQNGIIRKDNTSGYKGVEVCGKKWQSTININKKRFYLGVYNTPEEAAMVYDKAAKEKHGEFAFLNFPQD